ncbi:PREDICTED: coiled-coil domain-containing protein 97 [Nicrophorus vespilloides]|uniref:Coiled-coil domain-containing protein 97 n=1 Tax=Nicrophorus vespilloides TaxID=110193 RepID=A0ABM1MME6_NICVS|nr:PREDICTED: coiled-coil domain-containing protein 97 [Nicrophorus vespilloides]XP_017775754.1 PREDICTED: coiled-coil domain-containing protein 97 [Nicrophorus vespilloides]XP_017775762.1 PREDICTED: coiled-coil domain-containing protein 97 [Nicrophorus vespilloides]
MELEMLLEHLIEQPEIEFKSQQRDEEELSYEEKRGLALDILNANKYVFLNRFGKFLKVEHLKYFEQFVDETDLGKELKLLLDNIVNTIKKNMRIKRNRRFEALKLLIKGEMYFSDSEMMKRNPLLYDQLIGKYLTDEEIRNRDRASGQSTLVGILMEGIERDNARDMKQLQAEAEDDAMEEEDSSDDEEVIAAKATSSKWGVCRDMADKRINKNEFYRKQNNCSITANERNLLREEFITFMHQSFLDGLDDFNYAAVDDNDQYDNIDIVTHDAEDKYFDSEEPDELNMEIEDNNGKGQTSSEDELDTYMNALKNHPAINVLSQQLQKL